MHALVPRLRLRDLPLTVLASWPSCLLPLPSHSSSWSRCYAQWPTGSASDGGRSPKVRSAPPSGNAAFDEYREETLRKVADEQRGFREFLERLRRSKDKQEFDRFMADRRAAPSTGPQRSLPAV